MRAAIMNANKLDTYRALVRVFNNCNNQFPNDHYVEFLDNLIDNGLKVLPDNLHILGVLDSVLCDDTNSEMYKANMVMNGQTEHEFEIYGKKSKYLRDFINWDLKKHN